MGRHLAGHPAPFPHDHERTLLREITLADIVTSGAPPP
jgi:hypothetical protein